MSETTLAYELRDGLLQDLIAVGMLIEGARRSLRDGGPAVSIEALLGSAGDALSSDVEDLRAAIERLQTYAA